MGQLPKIHNGMIKCCSQKKAYRNKETKKIITHKILQKQPTCHKYTIKPQHQYILVAINMRFFGSLSGLANWKGNCEANHRMNYPSLLKRRWITPSWWNHNTDTRGNQVFAFHLCLIICQPVNFTTHEWNQIRMLIAEPPTGCLWWFPQPRGHKPWPINSSISYLRHYSALSNNTSEALFLTVTPLYYK